VSIVCAPDEAADASSAPAPPACRDLIDDRQLEVLDVAAEGAASTTSCTLGSPGPHDQHRAAPETAQLAFDDRPRSAHQALPARTASSGVRFLSASRSARPGNARTSSARFWTDSEPMVTPARRHHQRQRRRRAAAGGDPKTSSCA
jgi:hypothetical protein